MKSSSGLIGGEENGDASMKFLAERDAALAVLGFRGTESIGKGCGGGERGDRDTLLCGLPGAWNLLDAGAVRTRCQRGKGFSMDLLPAAAALEAAL